MVSNSIRTTLELTVPPRGGVGTNHHLGNSEPVSLTREYTKSHHQASPTLSI